MSKGGSTGSGQSKLGELIAAISRVEPSAAIEHVGQRLRSLADKLEPRYEQSDNIIEETREEGRQLLLYVRGLIPEGAQQGGGPDWLSYLFARVYRCLVRVLGKDEIWREELCFAPLKAIKCHVDDGLIDPLLTEICGLPRRPRVIVFRPGLPAIAAAAFWGDIGVRSSWQDPQRAGLLAHLQDRLAGLYENMEPQDDQRQQSGRP